MVVTREMLPYRRIMQEVCNEAIQEWWEESMTRSVKFTLEELWKAIKKRVDNWDSYNDYEQEWMKERFLESVEFWLGWMGHTLYLQTNDVMKVGKFRTWNDYLEFVDKNPDYEERVKKFIHG